MWAVCIGLDWGEEKHAFALQPRNGERQGGTFGSSPEDVHAWVRTLRERHREGTIAIVVEQSRGSLIYALMAYDFLEIIPVNPRASKAYRESRRLSGASSDPLDAELLCDYGLKHEGELRVWKADDELTRELRFMVEHRRTLVDEQTAKTHMLAATLRQYFPQALQWFGGETSELLRAVLKRWPTLAALRSASTDELRQVFKSLRLRKIEPRLEALESKIRQAVALTEDVAIIRASAMYAQTLSAVIDPLDEQIKSFDKRIAALWADHPDRELFDALPGAGRVMAPRLAVAFGIDRTRYQTADEIQCYSGIAPVQEQSGKHRWVHVRWGCPTFLRQSFHEFAQASLPHSAWAKAVYQEQRDRGAGHHEAIRALAFRWIRILFRLWQDHLDYDEAVHVRRLKEKHSPLVRRLAA